MAQNCEFCGSASLVPYKDVNELIRPESLLPMKVSESRVRDDIRKWYGSRWFAPNALGQKAMTDTLRGLYVPYWTFDARVHCPWTAEAGHYYYETVRRNGKAERVQRNPVGARGGRRGPLLRRHADRGHARRSREPAAEDRALPHHGPRALRPGLPRGVRGRALPGAAPGRRRAGRRAHVRGAAAAVRRRRSRATPTRTCRCRRPGPAARSSTCSSRCT